MSLSIVLLWTNLEVEVLLLGHLGDLLQEVLEPLLSGMGHIGHQLRTQLCHPKPPT